MLSLSTTVRGESMFRKLSGIVFAGVLTLLPAVVIGQAATSGITGVIKDQTGAVLPGATVQITNEATGAAIEATSDGLGAYRDDAVVPGAYRLRTVLDGF